jgi:hypothetical protein
MAAKFTPSSTWSVGRFSERWRFKREYQDSRNARSKALGLLDPFADLETVEPIARTKEVWGELRDFPDVPMNMLDDKLWHEVIAGGWSYDEAIHILEGRVAVLALKRVCRKLSNRSHRHLFLTDNMSVVLAFTKGRACDFGLLQLCTA